MAKDVPRTRKSTERQNKRAALTSAPPPTRANARRIYCTSAKQARRSIHAAQFYRRLITPPLQPKTTSSERASHTESSSQKRTSPMHMCEQGGEQGAKLLNSMAHLALSDTPVSSHALCSSGCSWRTRVFTVTPRRTRRWWSTRRSWYWSSVWGFRGAASCFCGSPSRRSSSRRTSGRWMGI